MTAINQLRPSWVRKINIARIEGCPVPGECWIWEGARTKSRSGFYGRIQQDGHCRYAHRVVYELLVGPIPDGLEIDHLCRQTECCNPQHLEPVTGLTNVRRGTRGSQTHCARGGHPLSGDNLYLAPHTKGYRRVCRKCRDENMAKWRLAQKERQRQTWAMYLDAKAVTA